MMIKAAKLGWAGAGKEQGWSRARKGKSRAGQEQGRSRNWAAVGYEQVGRSRVGVGEGAGAGKEQGWTRSRAEAGTG